MKEFEEERKMNKRLVTDSKECKVDIGEAMPRLLRAFRKAVYGYMEEISMSRPGARGRGYEAAVFNTKIIQSIQDEFGDYCRFGRYRRFYLRIVTEKKGLGYIFLFKKLNGKGMPMNIRTGLSDSIMNQEKNLFEDEDCGIDPILFFGYKKNKFGEISDPQIVYIDEGKVRWSISEKDLMGGGLEVKRQNPNPNLFPPAEVQLRETEVTEKKKKA